MYVNVDWHESAAELHARYRRESHGARRLKLHALWLVCAGRKTLREIGADLGVNERSVRRWVNRYRTGGLAAVLVGRTGAPGGLPARLTVEQDALLAAYALDGAFATAAAARDWVAATFGVTYTASGMRWHLRQLGIRPKRPRRVHAKADLAVQEAWKKGA